MFEFLKRLLAHLYDNRPKSPPRSQAPLPKSQAPTAPRPPLPPRERRLQLDAANLTPLSSTELKRDLGRRGGSVWQIFGRSSFWGRRDVVPPSSDERTRLIDRGMLGRGLVSAEELRRLHDHGDLLLERNPRLDAGRTAGLEAVTADREARARRKAELKAAAAQRKAERQAAIAQRHATDIVYLGRGVSAGLADRNADVTKLQRLGLPVLATPADIAQALGLSVPQLRWLAYHAEATAQPHYRRFAVPKRSGGVRELAAPMPKIRAAQDWLLHHVVSKVPCHAAAHGFVPKRSTLSNALPHLGGVAVANLDLRDFFPTITVHRVRGLFAELGYSPAVATILALLCTEAPRRLVEYAGQPLHVATGPRALPQGAPTSPALSNLIARRFDARLQGLAAKLGFTYTRYADDLTFSAHDGAAAELLGYLLARVRHIARAEGFAVNEAKTRILRRSASQQVTGVVVNGEVPRVPRQTVRRLRAILHQAQRTGLEAQNRDGHPDFVNHVRGLIAYVHMVQPGQAAPLREAWRKCRRVSG